MGILRKAIVAGGLFVALPMPPQGSGAQSAEQQAGPNTFAYMAAAAETFADVKSFCERRPTACNVAQYIAVTTEAKVKYSAKVVYEWANTPDEKESTVHVLDPQTADAGDIPLPVEKPANLFQRKTACQKKS